MRNVDSMYASLGNGRAAGANGVSKGLPRRLDAFSDFRRAAVRDSDWSDVQGLARCATNPRE